MPAKIGGVPSPLDHQALRLVIALWEHPQMKIKIFTGDEHDKRFSG
jgi:hypothetical protein